MTHSRFDGLCIIDADTHLTEPHDLWTARAPKGYEDRVPQVHDVDGVPTWTMDGKALLARRRVRRRRGRRREGPRHDVLPVEHRGRAPRGVRRRRARARSMDEQGIWAQIVYPNTVGFGGQKFRDHRATRRCAAFRSSSTTTPWPRSRTGRASGSSRWGSCRGGTSTSRSPRSSAWPRLGLRGLNTTTAPHDHGLPDLGDEHWNPMWEAVAAHDLPINFHIGASDSSLSWFGSVPWPSLNGDQKLGLGSAMMYLNNAGVIGNIIYSGVLERFPDAAVRVGGERRRVDPVPAQGARLPGGRDDAGVDGQPLDGAVGLLPPPDPLVLLVRAQPGSRRRSRAWAPTTSCSRPTSPTRRACTPTASSYADAALDGVGDDDVAGIMGLNAARLYDIPLPA